MNDNTNNIPVYAEPEGIDYIIIKVKENVINGDRGGNLYETTRRAWHAKLETAMPYRYVLSVVGGVVQEVYKVSRWYTSPTDAPRIEFEGEVAEFDIRNLFVGKMIPECYRQKGLASPFLYKKKAGANPSSAGGSTANTRAEGERRMHRYTVEITTKGSYDIELASLAGYGDDETIDTFELDTDFVLNYALDQDFELDGLFSLEVKDEDGNEVFKSEEFQDFMYITDCLLASTKEEFVEEMGYDEEDADEYGYDSTISMVGSKKYKEELSNKPEPGLYFFRAHFNKWRTCRFVIEDTEFHAEKFKFIPMGKYICLFRSGWTDMEHVVYVDRFIEPEMSEGNYDYDYTQETYYEYGQKERVYKYDERRGWVPVIDLQGSDTFTLQKIR